MTRRILWFAALVTLTLGAASCGSAQGVKRTSVEELDIENPGTRKFLEEVNYAADTAYTLSFAREYMEEYGASDKPLPVTISWTGEASRLILSTAANFKDSVDPLSPEEIELLRKYLIVKD